MDKQIPAAPQTLNFTCNICGAVIVDYPTKNIDRELISCACGSTVRIRSIAHLVSLTVFERAMTVPEFPVQKQIRGVGLSDSEGYASALADRFSYTNTFLHKEPLLNIEDPPAEQFETYDFLISADVFEHVKPPPINAFRNARRLLKPGGHLILTVPFTISEETIEHFPKLQDFRVVHFYNDYFMIERSTDGTFSLHSEVVFHGGAGSTLEMRVFCRKDLQRLLEESGFEDIRFFEDDYLPYGIINQSPWGFPILARRPLSESL